MSDALTIFMSELPVALQRRIRAAMASDTRIDLVEKTGEAPVEVIGTLARPVRAAEEHVSPAALRELEENAYARTQLLRAEYEAAHRDYVRVADRADAAAKAKIHIDRTTPPAVPQ